LALRALVIDRERGAVPNFARVVIETSGLADRLVISKSDLAGATDLDALRDRLQKLNPRAGIDIAIAGALDPKRFVAPSTTERSGFVAEAEHSDGIVSFVLERQQPVEWAAFCRAMETLIALRGPELLRVKGILNVAGCRGPVVVQYVQHLAHPPVELQSWPDQNRDSRVVFITRQLGEAQIRDLFAAVEALANDGAREI
jgi:G3E family GTPase